jgi:two-component system response regulator YesN
MNILILDDEKLVCDGLKSMLERFLTIENCNITTSTNPEDALEIYEEIKPDLVITDIIMPNMNGVEFVLAAKAISDTAKFLVLSSSNDYTFVRNCFKMGVDDYLLKPVLFTDFKAVITKILKDMDVKSNELDSYRKIILESVFDEEGISVSDSTFERFKEAFPYLNSVCATIFFEKPEKFLEKEKEICHEFLKTDKTEVVLYCHKIDNKEIVLIYNFSDESLQEFCKHNFIEIFKKFAEVDIYGSLSECYNDNNSVKMAYNGSQLALGKRIIDEKANMFFEDITKDYIFSNLKTFYEKINNSIDSSNFNVLITNELIFEIFSPQNISKISISEINRLYKLVLKKIENILLNIEKEAVKHRYNELRDFKNLSDLRKYLFKNITELEEITDSNNEKELSVIKKCIDFINENYNREITLSDLSEVTFLSYSYLSRYFKKYCSMTFTKYLNKVRLGKALELIRNTDHKISEICDMVGYSSVNAQNFTRAFRKEFGFSPSEVKKENRDKFLTK